MLLQTKATLSTMTRRSTETSIMTKLVMNHDSQCTALLSPITFITSFRRHSFSYTMSLTIIAAVNIHESVINNGMLREMAFVNLNRKQQLPNALKWQRMKVYNIYIFASLSEPWNKGVILNLDVQFGRYWEFKAIA